MMAHARIGWAVTPLDVIAGAGAGIVIGAVLTLVVGPQNRRAAAPVTAGRRSCAPDERPVGAS
jgi:membrane-associated phospholipid phosphatase